MQTYQIACTSYSASQMLLFPLCMQSDYLSRVVYRQSSQRATTANTQQKKAMVRTPLSSHFSVQVATSICTLDQSGGAHRFRPTTTTLSYCSTMSIHRHSQHYHDTTHLLAVSAGAEACRKLDQMRWDATFLFKLQSQCQDKATCMCCKRYSCIHHASVSALDHASCNKTSRT